MKATHKEVRQMVGYQEVTLTPGQFIFGRIKAAKETNLSEKKIRTCLDKLKNMQNLTIKTASKYSIITIVNWEEYQSETAIKSASKGPAKGQQRATNKNDNNEKKDNRLSKDILLSKLRKEFPDFTDLDYEAAEGWIISWNKKHPKKTRDVNLAFLINWAKNNLKGIIYDGGNYGTDNKRVPGDSADSKPAMSSRQYHK